MVAVRAIPNIGGEAIGGQMGRSKNMVQSGAMANGCVDEGKVMTLGPRESGVKVLSK